MINNATILLTGGTGSFGKKFIAKTFAKYNPKKIIVFSRDEMKQWEMMQQYKDENRLRFFLGDVRDEKRLHRALNEVDIVVHAAANKIVPTAEYNPFEYIKTNVNGAMNIIDAAIDQKVKKVVALSTDKACNPVNLYGATKLCSDKIFIAGNNYTGMQDTRFSVVRYGNVMGSRGSIIPHFLNAVKQNGELTVTDDRMSRFFITLDMAVELVWLALEEGLGGEIFVRKCPSMKITDLATAIAPSAKQTIMGIRPGEKLHEIMISEEDSAHTFEYDNYYKIVPEIINQYTQADFIKGGKPCDPGFSYTSGCNKDWWTIEAMREWLKKEYGHVAG